MIRKFIHKFTRTYEVRKIEGHYRIVMIKGLFKKKAFLLAGRYISRTNAENTIEYLKKNV